MGPRDGRGYHPVSTLMQTIALADPISVTAAWEYHLEMSMPQRDLASVSLSVSVEDNLVTKAYRWAKRRVPEIPAIHVRVIKRIPQGAGLGGGSADAAAILRWAHRLFPQGFNLRETSSLGMDVPFLIDGGSAKATGYGQELTPLDPLLGWHVIVASPPIALSTAQVYQAFDEINPSALPAASVEEVARDLSRGQLPFLFNALEPAAWRVEPSLQAFKAELTRETGKPWFLTGSGAAYFTLVRDPQEARAVKRRIWEQHLPLSRLEVAKFVGPTSPLGPQEFYRT